MIGGPRNRWLQAAFNIVLVGILLFGLSFLPPDNSLAEVREAGVLKLCVPENFPPLAQNDPGRPGFDVELVRKAAEEIGIRVTVNVMASMGKDFNPRNWRLTRGQCNIIAGGVADTTQTRNFLQTIPTDVETGWVGISHDGAQPVQGSTWAVWPGTSGLDRLSLSSWLRERGVRPRLIRSPDELQAILDDGTVAGAIVERFAATSVDTSRGYKIFWLAPERFERFRMALGLWKGDQTLYRAVQSAIQKIKESDKVGFLRIMYGLN